MAPGGPINPDSWGPACTTSGTASQPKVTDQSVRNQVHRGQLAAIRVGSRRVRIRRSDLDAFLGVGATNQAAESTRCVTNCASASMMHVPLLPTTMLSWRRLLRRSPALPNGSRLGSSATSQPTGNVVFKDIRVSAIQVGALNFP